MEENEQNTPTLLPEGTVALLGHVTVSPDGLEDVPRFTVPANPLRLMRLIVVFVEELDVERLNGAVMLKSVTEIGTATECTIDPLVPMKVTV